MKAPKCISKGGDKKKGDVLVSAVRQQGHKAGVKQLLRYRAGTNSSKGENNEQDLFFLSRLQQWMTHADLM